MPAGGVERQTIRNPHIPNLDNVRNAVPFTPGQDPVRFVPVRFIDRPLAGFQRAGTESGTFRPRQRHPEVGKVLSLITQDAMAEAIRKDREALNELEARETERQWRFPSVTVGDVTYRHPEIGTVMGKERPTSERLRSVKGLLKEKDAFHLHTHNGIHVTVSGEDVPITVLSATDTKVNGEMDSQMWVRDMVRAGESEYDIWRLDPDGNIQSGLIARDLLLTNMHLMSTDAQLARFRNIIANPELQHDHNAWPQIAMQSDKLDSSEPTDWRHPQDAWQMLGINLIKVFETFDDPNDATIQHRLIAPETLLEGNREMLRLMPHFLEAIDFTTAKNSGTWEEVRTPKTSVIGIETALLHRMWQQSDNPEFAFLHEGMEPEAHKAMLDELVNKGLNKLGQNLPYETPDADPNSFDYRTADATLVYLLEYGIPQLMEERSIPVTQQDGTMKPMTAVQIEGMILDQLRKLHDPVTHGMRRYGANQDPQWDSYLGDSFNTNRVKVLVDGVKQYVKQKADGGPIDLVKKAELRQDIVPDGPTAAWLHPNAQISTWASKRYLETGENRYYDIAMEFMEYTLAGVTGPHDFHPLWNGKEHEIHQAKEAGFTEAWMYQRKRDGSGYVVMPSPHDPLKWAEEEGKRALEYAIVAAERHEQETTTALRFGEVGEAATASGEYEIYLRPAS